MEGSIGAQVISLTREALGGVCGGRGQGEIERMDKLRGFQERALCFHFGDMSLLIYHLLLCLFEDI